MDLSRLPPPGGDPTRPRRPTHRVERAALIGAAGLGVPAWIAGAILLSRHYETLPADGFNWLAYRMDLLGIVVAASVAGALIAAVAAIARSSDRELRRPRVVVSMGIFSALLMLVMAPFVLVAVALAGPGAIGFAAIAAVAFGVRWGARVGYPSVLHGDALSLMTGRTPADRPPG